MLIGIHLYGIYVLNGLMNIQKNGGFDPIANEPRIVEIDESCFMRKKYNQNRLWKKQWVFKGSFANFLNGFI